jgi:hypothetical protein
MKTRLKQTWIAAAAVGLLCALPASAQKKEVLAIGKIEPTKALAEDMQRKNRTIEMRRVIESMDSHLISALAQTRKFTLVGRSDLADLLKEQDLGDSGIVDAESAAEKGKVKGAKFRLVTTVDSFLEVFWRRMSNKCSRAQDAKARSVAFNFPRRPRSMTRARGNCWRRPMFRLRKWMPSSVTARR